MSGKSILAPGPPSWEAAGRFFLDECISVRQSYDFVEDKTLSAVISSSFAILRHKPLTLQKTPSFPSTLHSYESPAIHSGFMHLVNSYHLLDSSFVDSWNESASAPASTATYTSLQQQLSRPHSASISLTSIQKADILVTQQWLRLIVWQSSMRQGLLSSNAEDESMTFRYPLKIAHSLLDVISSLPTHSIEVHGMGIFEKIFEIGNTMLDVMQACGSSIPNESYGVVQDPFEVFVKTLSQTPNSQRQYANLLLAKAAEKPEIQRFGMSLNGPLSAVSGSVEGSEGLISPIEGGFPYLGTTDGNAPGSELDVGMEGLPVPRGWRGSIVGEIGEGLDLGGGFGALGGGLGVIPPPVSTTTRQWRGSIVGEIGDDGVYKENEEVESVDYMNGNGNANGNGNVHWTDEGQGDDVWVGVDESVGGEEAWLKMEEGIL
ncbi:hypothetical protein IFR04_013118 [Cadophora malorum]|uniref:Uncharacterized protein n=1 Tax=Cadophora malorum TaxID=108018 RepID=A0A8H7T7I7_9HELO|nr:hypothetical protein IFR04_013118 [Cadophora malorum]